MRGSTIFFTVLAMWFGVGSAQAGIEVCNKTGKTVWVAVTWNQPDDSSMASSISWGWLKVDAGACTQFFGAPRPLETDGSASYYAVVRDDAGFWSSIKSEDEVTGGLGTPASRSFCIKPTDDFTIAEIHSMRLDCERRDYFLLETEKQKDFTMTLLPR